MLTAEISIIVPTYRRADLLPEALRSLVGQTFSNWEALVIDDNGVGSEVREEVREVVASIADPRIRLLENDRNRGAQYTRNHGLREARGAWVAILDDDDIWHAEKLEKQLELAATSPLEPGFVGCAWEVFGESGTLRPRCTPTVRGQVADDLVLNRIGPTSIILVRRNLLERVGAFDESLTHRNDIDLYLRLAFETSFDWCQDVLVRHRAHPNRISSNTRGRIGAHLVFYEKYRGYIDSSAQRTAEFFGRLGELHLACDDRREAARCFLRALRARPTDPRVLAQLAMTPFGSNFLRKARKLKAKATATLRRTSR